MATLGLEHRDLPVAERQQLQFRCSRCNRRLADYLDDISLGRLFLEIKCPKCGVSNSLLVKAG